MGAGTTGADVELSRLPKERGAEAGTGSEEDAGAAPVGWIPNVNVGLAPAAGALRPKTAGDPALTNWMLPKMEPLLTAVDATAGAVVVTAASAGLLTCKEPPRGKPEGAAVGFGGCTAGTLAGGGLGGAALAFSSACPTLSPEKLPRVSPATGAWNAGVSPCFDGRFSHGPGAAEETVAEAVAAWAGSPELLLVAEVSKRLEGFADPKANGVSVAVPNAAFPPRGKASGWLGSIPRVVVTAKGTREGGNFSASLKLTYGVPPMPELGSVISATKMPGSHLSLNCTPPRN